jgi:hypothetical protein
VSVEDLQSLPLREDRRAGAILGLAVGDALGATYEFCPPREVPEGPLEMVGGEWLGLERWRWHLGSIRARLPVASNGQFPHASLDACDFYYT